MRHLILWFGHFNQWTIQIHSNYQDALIIMTLESYIYTQRNTSVLKGTFCEVAYLNNLHQPYSNEKMAHNQTKLIVQLKPILKISDIWKVTKYNLTLVFRSLLTINDSDFEFSIAFVRLQLFESDLTFIRHHIKLILDSHQSNLQAKWKS